QVAKKERQVTAQSIFLRALTLRLGAFARNSWKRVSDMRWKWVLLVVLAVVGAAVYSFTEKSPTTLKESARPNILLVSLDTLRADHLGCYGYDKQTSPNLDRFAEQSVRFTNCRAQAPWTLPSHMALFTSMLPTDNGVDNLNKVLPPEIPT